MKPCKKLLVSLAMLAMQLAWGQHQNLLVPKVIPPSPDAASLGKYGNTPVGLHTGIPEVNIPIYTIKTSKLELPISLSYHASGHRVNELASWVGLGWSLNAGGVISKTIVGISDDGGFWSYTGELKHADEYTAEDYLFLRSMVDRESDSETDLYFYNFCGHSGKFIFEQNDPYNPFLITEVPLRISRVGGWHAVDEKGTRYKFGIAENMIVPPQSTPTQSSAYLTEMISADGSDKIVFNYTADGDYLESGTSDVETVGHVCTSAGQPSTGYHQTSTTGTGQTIMPMRLTEIVYSTGKIQFVRDTTRSDLPWTSRLAEIRIFARSVDGTFESAPRKTFELGEGYFQTPAQGSFDADTRLKLTEVVEKDQQGAFIGRNTVTYDSTVLPHRTSPAQDWWGFFNGQTDNTSLIPETTVTDFPELSLSVTVGTGNSREPNAQYMDACMLKKITYPTGGYTEFDFEPHTYLDFGGSHVPDSAYAASGAAGNTTGLLEQTVTFSTGISTWAELEFYGSNVTGTNLYFSRVSLRKQGDPLFLVDHQYDNVAYSPFNPELREKYFAYLEQGVTYELKVSSKGTSGSTVLGGAAFSRATVRWNEVSGGGTQNTAGGLRVKEIRDYPAAGATPIRKHYVYGYTNGNGFLLVPKNGMSVSRQEADFRYNHFDGIYCNTDACEGRRLIFSGRPAFDLTTLSGAPVVYGKVTVIEGDLSAPNGKVETYFKVQQDQFSPAPKAHNNGMIQLNTGWMGGEEIRSVYYKGNTTTMIKETGSTHHIFKQRQTIGTKVGWKVTAEGCNPSIGSEIYMVDFPTYTGVKKLIQSEEREYSPTNQSLIHSSLTRFYYDNLDTAHQQLSRKIVLDSRNDTLASKYWYTPDYNNVGNISTLKAKHIIGVPIKEELHINSKLVSGKISKLDDFGNPVEIHLFETDAPTTFNHDPAAIVPASSPYKKRADIAYNNTTKSIKSVKRTDDAATSYFWGYNKTLPIAEIRNAEISEMTTNFGNFAVGEATVTSSTSELPLGPGFTIPTSQSLTTTLTVAVMGTNAPSGPAITLRLKDLFGTVITTHDCVWGTNSVPSISVAPGIYHWYYTSGLTTGGGFNGADVDISCGYTDWRTGYTCFHTSFEEDGVTDSNAKTGTRVRNTNYTLVLPGTNGTYKLSYWKRITDLWTLIEQDVTVTSGAVGTMVLETSGGIIDEVRLYPPGAIITTYTYDPIIGVTSMTDANHFTTWYQYDAAGRLESVKDHEKNIVKTNQYHYKQ